MKKIPFVLALFVLASNLCAQITNVRAFAFGHSLIDHRPPAIETPSDETTVFHWVSDMAQAAGYSFAAGGQYGFLPSHDNLPPMSIWGYDIVPGIWDEDVETFAEADINTILLTAANFIQYEPSDAPHPIDATTSVLTSTETIFDWVAQQEMDVRFFVYANWPEMDLQNAYPPNLPLQAEIDAYHNQTITPFMDWWIDYQDHLLASRPDYQTRLIPVGSIISKILTELIPDQVPFSELYEDSDPHGRPSLYFLAGMITYMAFFEEKMPAEYEPSVLVHEAIRNQLSTISDFAWNELLDFNLPNGESRVFSSLMTQTEDLPTNSLTSIKLFPNPSNGFIQLKGLANKNNIQVLDAFGNKYFYPNYSEGKTLDLSNLPDGLYIIQIQDLNGTMVGQERVIKQN